MAGEQKIILLNENHENRIKDIRESSEKQNAKIIELNIHIGKIESKNSELLSKLQLVLSL